MIKRLLEQFMAQETAEETPNIGLAAAVLLVEVTKADNEIDDTEHKAMLSAIRLLCPDLDADAPCHPEMVTGRSSHRCVQVRFLAYSGAASLSL